MHAGSIGTKDRPKIDIPASMPSANGAVGGPWSSVPLWRGLDSDFLCEPSIPKPPLTPRFQVDEVITLPKLQANPFLGSEEKSVPRRPTPVTIRQSVPRTKMLVVSAALGFVGGMLMAWCSGLLG